jgi:hypothetical protein
MFQVTLVREAKIWSKPPCAILGLWGCVWEVTTTFTVLPLRLERYWKPRRFSFVDSFQGCLWGVHQGVDQFFGRRSRAYRCPRCRDLTARSNWLVRILLLWYKVQIKNQAACIIRNNSFESVRGSTYLKLYIHIYLHRSGPEIPGGQTVCCPS